jgi:hypothetical protein
MHGWKRIYRCSLEPTGDPPAGTSSAADGTDPRLRKGRWARAPGR